MERNIEALQDTSFDVVVVGGGIVGACAAWEASLRGLRVALVERGDFASGTSANSLKIIHGGLRYLQNLDLRRTLRSLEERTIWLRAAPHLVEPIPFLVPLDGRGLSRPFVLAAGMTLHDLLGRRQNRDMDPSRFVPRGRVASVEACESLFPALRNRRLVGGALFHDGLVYDTERLIFEVISAAHEAGAAVSNYTEFLGVTSSSAARGGRVAVRDRSGEYRFEVRTKSLLNAAGPWGASIVPGPEASGGEISDAIPSRHCIALNLVTSRPAPEAALGLEIPESEASSNTQQRRLFLVPWRNQAVIGTGYYPEDGRSTDELAEEFRQTANRTLPGFSLSPDEVKLVHTGRLPIRQGEASGPAHRLLDEGWVLDHGRDGGVPMISAGTVKYTTGRWIAEKAVDRVCRRLGYDKTSPATRRARLPGCPEGTMEELEERALEWARREGLSDSSVRHLVRAYGRRYDRVVETMLNHADGTRPIVPQTPVTMGELRYCAEEEMAVRTEDLLFRRTELAARGWDNRTAREAAERALSSDGAPPRLRETTSKDEVR